MKHLVLLGAGHAHINLLASLARQPLPGRQVTLVAPYPRQLYSGMVPGFVAGHYHLDECSIALAALLDGSGVAYLQRSVAALDAPTGQLTLDDGSTLGYDVLSINTGATQDRQQIERWIPGAARHALFVRPIERFAELWPKVVELATSRALRVTVIGAGAAGIELACAMAYRLPTATVTVVAGETPPGAAYPSSAQNRIAQALKLRRITVLQERAVGISADTVQLANGARLACDVPVIAVGTQAPSWLQGSGLALDDHGFVAVDMYQRSTSHRAVFAAGDVSTRVDRKLARSGVYAVRAGLPLANNLRAVMGGVEPRAYQPPEQTLNLLSCGDKFAIGVWGRWSFAGRWVWLLKDWIDRRFIGRYGRRRKR